jgi:hypothetical protein
MGTGRAATGLLALTLAAMTVGYVIGVSFHEPQVAQAAGGEVKTRTGPAPKRYVYYPGTEQLRKDEIRMTACGTGMPAARHGQRATVRQRAAF